MTSTGLRCTLLGPLTVRRGDVRLGTGSPQQGALLAALLLRGGRTAGIGDLVAALWEGEPPARAVGMIRTYVSRLRLALEEDRARPRVLVSVGRGYALRVPPESVDAVVFERLVRDARDAAGRGDHAEARRLLLDADALWGGEPLVGLPGPSAAAHRERLRLLRLDALEARLDADLALGDHAEAAVELAALAAAHPLREHLHGLRMLALYRSGRRAEALESYAAVRRALHEELGTRPGRPLQDLHQHILRSTPDTQGPASFAAPSLMPVTRGDWPTAPTAGSATSSVWPAAPDGEPTTPRAWPTTSSAGSSGPGGASAASSVESVAPLGWSGASSTGPDVPGAWSGVRAARAGVPGGVLGVRGAESGVPGDESGAPEPGAGVRGTEPGVRGAGAGLPGDGSGVSGSRASSGDLAGRAYELPSAVPDFVGRTAELACLRETLTNPDRRGRAPVIVTLAGGAGVGKTTLAVQAAHEMSEAFPDGILYADLGSVGTSSAWASPAWASPTATSATATSPAATYPPGASPEGRSPAGTAPPGTSSVGTASAGLAAAGVSPGELGSSEASPCSVGAAPVEPGVVLRGFLRRLGVPDAHQPNDVAAAAALYRSWLADRKVLVVLDNAGDTARLRPLLPGGEGCAVLVVGRARPAALPVDRHLDLGALDRRDALDLFARVAGEARTAAERSAAEEVLRLCDRLPLAVRIVASRLATRPDWTVERLLARLVDGRRRLAELRIGRTAVESTYQLAYDHLAPAQARAFRLLALSAAPVLSTETAAALLGTGDEEAEDLADSLVELGMLASPAPRRYRFHNLPLLFARALTDHPEQPTQATRRAHDVLRAQDAQRAQDTPPGQDVLHGQDALRGQDDQRGRDGQRGRDASRGRDERRGQDERRGLEERRGAYARLLAYHLEAQREALVLLGESRALAARTGPPRFASANAASQWTTDHLSELLALIRYYAADGVLPLDGVAELTLALAQQLDDGPRWTELVDAARALLDAGTAARNQRAEMAASFILGYHLIHCAKRPGGAALVGRAAELCRELKDETVLAEALSVLALDAFYRRDHATSLRRCKEVLEIDIRTGNVRGQATRLTNIAQLHLELGDKASAMAAAYQGLALARRADAPVAVAYALYLVGQVLESLDQHVEALGAYDEALTVCWTHSLPMREAQVLMRMAETRLALGQFGDAADTATQSLAVARVIGGDWQQARTRTVLGRALAALGQTGRARREWRTALTVFTALGAAEADGVRVLLAAGDAPIPANPTSTCVR